jgi:arginyl-tRNA synthetase
MASPSEGIRDWFVLAIESAISNRYGESGLDRQQIINSISTPKKEFGDLSSSVAIRISKELKRKPDEIAAEIADGIAVSGMIKEVKAFGGYINATVDEVEYSKWVIEAVLREGDRYGSCSIGSGKKVLVEFPAVNPNKPWHIGHLRNALLGDSISNILEFCSYKVEREDYIDDLGIQMAEIVWGYQSVEKADKSKKFDHWIGEQYVRINRRMESEEGAKEKISEVSKRMEMSGTEESRLARDLSMNCAMAQYETAYSYGIYHDVMIWESDIVHAKLLERALGVGMEMGALNKPSVGKNAGCIVFNLDSVRSFAREFENPNEHEKVIMRSDGTATYVAKDLAFHMWKLGILDAKFEYKEVLLQKNGKTLYSTADSGRELDFGHADTVVNIIGSAQKYPQLILKAVLSLAGYSEAANRIVHVAYGEVSVDSGSLSGRSGGWIGEGKSYTADVLLEEAKKKAEEATEKSKKIEDRKLVAAISTEVGRAAIKFEYLKVSPEKPVIFSWSTALNFEGNSGPYCMYSYARAGRILKKGGYGYGKLEAGDYAAVGRGYDFELIKLMGSAGDAIRKAAEEYATNVIADYVINLTSIFSKFYESTPVIGSKEQPFRMELVHAYMITLSNMLRLLGIKTVEEM